MDVKLGCRSRGCPRDGVRSLFLFWLRMIAALTSQSDTLCTNRDNPTCAPQFTAGVMIPRLQVIKMEKEENCSEKDVGRGCSLEAGYVYSSDVI